MNFRLILKTRVAVWPFSSATYWEDFFECCNVKHISIQTFISKNFSANFFLWLLFALFHCLPIREIFDESDPFQRKDSTSGQNFLKTFDLYPLFCISFSVNSRSLHNSDSNIPLCEFLLIFKKEVVKTPFSLPTKWEENFKISISECDNSITILIWMLRNRRSHRLPIEQSFLFPAYETSRFQKTHF